jgi:hypothetical protein
MELLSQYLVLMDGTRRLLCNHHATNVNQVINAQTRQLYKLLAQLELIRILQEWQHAKIVQVDGIHRGLVIVDVQNVARILNALMLHQAL